MELTKCVGYLFTFAIGAAESDFADGEERMSVGKTLLLKANLSGCGHCQDKS